MGVPKLPFSALGSRKMIDRRGIIEVVKGCWLHPLTDTDTLLSAGCGDVIVSHVASLASSFGGTPMDRTWYIYVLIDPRTDAVRYVGVTVAPQHRLTGHIRDASYQSTRKANWIKQLLRCELRPEMRILEEVIGHDLSREAERRWIAHYRAEGAILTNATDGGDGAPGCKWSEEQRAKIIGRKLSDETKQKLSKYRKGTPISDEQRQRLIALHTGKPLSDEHKQKIRERHTGRVLPREGIEKMRASLTGRKNGPPSEETRRKLSASKIGQPQLCGICKSPDHNRRTCPQRGTHG